jgi:hypothetical protein
MMVFWQCQTNKKQRNLQFIFLSKFSFVAESAEISETLASLSFISSCLGSSHLGNNFAS